MEQGIRDGAELLIQNIQKVISVDRKKLEYILAAKIAGGHVILADFHGVGKTSLARALAGSIHWHSEDLYTEGVKLEKFSRIQCTVDLLPQDILGYNRFIGNGREMVFNKGPIFAHFVLCDEINLLTPKTQGSFLQVMEEQTVTIEGKTYTLPDPFFIIATMNLKGVHLFPLPAPQLDRFMIRLSLGYPSQEAEEGIIRRHGRLDGWADFGPVIDSTELVRWKKQVDEVLKTLTPREERVIRLRFGIDDGYHRTLEEVGNIFQVTRERIRQIEDKALKKLRHPSRAAILQQFLDNFHVK